MIPKPAALLALSLCTLGLTGCIERTLTINSDPPGALVHLNDVEVGRTPVTVPFIFYGVYDVRLQKQGYQTLSVAQPANAPWWDHIGPDIIAEAVPGVHHIALDWQFSLQPVKPVNPEALIDRATQLRATVKRELPPGSTLPHPPGQTAQPITTEEPAPPPVTTPILRNHLTHPPYIPDAQESP